MASDTEDVRVVLRVDHRLDDPEQHCLAVLGSSHEMGCWKPDKAIRAEYMGRSTWQAVVKLPPNESVVWKWVVIDVNSSEIVQWESGVDKIIDVKDKPLMGICEWGNPVEVTDISSESSVRLFQGVHDIGELPTCRRRDRTREQSSERRDQSTGRRNTSSERRKRSTERRRQSAERRRRSTERRKQSLERNVQAKGGKGKKLKRVKSKTKVPEDSTDKLRNVRSQTRTDVKVKISTAKDVKAIAGVCQLSPTDNTGESRFMIPEAPVKVKHSNGLKEFFLRKLRSQASKHRTHGKVLGKAINADRETIESHSDKDSLSESPRELKCTDKTDKDARKTVATNRESVHSLHQTAKHTVLSKYLLNSILSDENLTEEINEASELELSDESFKRNIDSADVQSFVSLGFATDCIISFDKTFDPFENTALIEMNLKDYDLVSSASDSLIPPDKTTHSLTKTKSEDSLYGHNVFARHTDANVMEQRPERDAKLHVATDTIVDPLNIMTGDCKSKSDKDKKGSLETEHSAGTFSVEEKTKAPEKMVDEVIEHALPLKDNKGLKHTVVTESPHGASVSDTTVNKKTLNCKQIAENAQNDDNPVKVFCKESESLHEKVQSHIEIENKTKENEIKILEMQNNTIETLEQNRSPENQKLAVLQKDDGHSLKDEATGETICTENQTSAYTTKSFTGNDHRLLVDEVTCTKGKCDKQNLLKDKKYNESGQLGDTRTAPKVPEKTFCKSVSLANEKEKYNVSEHVTSLSAKFSRKDNVVNNAQFCGNKIKVEHRNPTKFNRKATIHDTHAKRMDNQAQINDKIKGNKDNVSDGESNQQNRINIIEGTCIPKEQLTRMQYQTDEVNSRKNTNNPNEQPILAHQNQGIISDVATCLCTEENREKHQTLDKSNNISSHPDTQLNNVVHKNQIHINEAVNDPAAKPNCESTIVTYTEAEFAGNLKLQNTSDRDDRESSSHEIHVAEKEHVTKLSTGNKSDLYSCHSIADKYLSVVNPQDLASQPDTTFKPSGSVISKFKDFNPKNPKPVDKNAESMILSSCKAGIDHDESDKSVKIKDDETGVNKLEDKDDDQSISEIEKAKYHNETDQIYNRECVELDAQDKGKTDDAHLNDSHLDSKQLNTGKGLSRKLLDKGVSPKKCNVENKLDETRIFDKYNQLENDHTLETDSNELRPLHGETTVTENTRMTNLIVDSSVNDTKSVSVNESEQVSSLISVRKERRSTSNNSKDSHLKDKSEFRKRSDTISYIDETDQISLQRHNKSGSVDKNIPKQIHSPNSLSPKSKVYKWLKQRNAETGCDERQGTYANQTSTPKDVDEYLNDLHKETPSYTKSVVALLEQNINCVGKVASGQQTLEDGYQVTKKYSECNKTMDYANVSCSYSPRCEREEKEQNIQTDVLASKESSLWDLVEKYKVPIGVSIAAACATVLICKKKL